MLVVIAAIVPEPLRHTQITALAIRRAARHIRRMRIVFALIVIALMALLGASLCYAYGIWTRWQPPTCRAGCMLAMVGGVFFSLLVGGGLMGARVLFQPRRATTTARRKSDLD